MHKKTQNSIPSNIQIPDQIIQYQNTSTNINKIPILKKFTHFYQMTTNSKKTILMNQTFTKIVDNIHNYKENYIILSRLKFQSESFCLVEQNNIINTRQHLHIKQFSHFDLLFIIGYQSLIYRIQENIPETIQKIIHKRHQCLTSLLTYLHEFFLLLHNQMSYKKSNPIHQQLLEKFKNKALQYNNEFLFHVTIPTPQLQIPTKLENQNLLTCFQINTCYQQKHLFILYILESFQNIALRNKINILDLDVYNILEEWFIHKFHNHIFIYE